MVTPLEPGVWGVLATPFTGSVLDLDEAGLSRLCEYYDTVGVTGLTALGVFGEAARLTAQERATVLEIVADTCGLPIVVGATSLTTRVVIEEARRAAEVAGDRVAGVMVQVNTAAPTALGDHLQAVHDATGLPIVVQDYPAVSGVVIRPEALVAALKGKPFCAAVKAESPPTAVAVHALASGLDVPVFGGLGGIGLNVLQGLRLAGADMIIGVDLNNDKKEWGERFGMTHFVNPKEVDGDIVPYLVNLTKRGADQIGGADYTFDCTGNVTVMRQALECSHRGWGQSIVIGVAGAGQEVSTRPFQLVTGRVWKGTAFGGARGRTDVPKIVDWYMAGKIQIDPMITHTLRLEDINKGFDLMHEGKSIRSVVVY